MTKTIVVEGIGEVISGFTDDDLKRIIQDGFIAIRDDGNHLLMYYHPARNVIEIKHRGHIIMVDLNKYRELDEHEKAKEQNKSQIAFWSMLIDRHIESAVSAAQMQGGADGRRTNE